MPPPTSESVGATTPDTPSARPHDPTRALFALLLAFRLANALTLRTFFQPDEYFQSLEPAWRLAFGQSSNAWITWEWTSQLRSSLHPALFAASYRLATHIADICALSLPASAQLLLATPKVTQAIFAALLDYYVWRLAEKVYGRGSRASLATLALSVCSPWQWFCSARTLSNCLETTLTSIAIYYWPWQWPLTAIDNVPRSRDAKHVAHAEPGAVGSLTELRLSLLLAAIACILRPTNILIWVPLAAPTFWQASKRLRYILLREIVLCGSSVLAVSIVSDRLYYGIWTLPPLRFLYFNIAQSLAVFYGRNRPDYYFTEGLPLLLTTALPFAAVGLWQSLCGPPGSKEGPTSVKDQDNLDHAHGAANTLQHRVLTRLAWTSLIMTFTLSLIAHKEVRFLYPILPSLHLLAARPLSTFLPANAPLSRRAIITLLLSINLLLAAYASQIHQRGVIDVLHHLRHTHEATNNLAAHTSPPTQPHTHNTTVAFLMPCHSTPWRSHLVHPGITAWALTCDPPIDVPLAQRAAYVDEADAFYADPAAWLRTHMADPATIAAGGSRSGQHWAAAEARFKTGKRREWPSRLVFFEGLEGVLGEVLAGSRYAECWRGFNSHWHDDGRRVGDVVVWCLE